MMAAVPQYRRAFTLIELLVVLAIIMVLASLILPALAGAKEQARRIKCISNLKQIGLAARTYATDREGNFPWHTLASDGGTYGTPTAASAWGNFSALSNELMNPLVLVCPSDSGTKKPTAIWAEFLSAPFRSNSVSFWVGLDAFEELPTVMLAGDGNITGGVADTCGSVADPPGIMAREYTPGNPSIRWEKAIHGLSGDIALTDGSVQKVRNPELLDLVNITYRMLTNAPIRSHKGKRLSNHLLSSR